MIKLLKIVVVLSLFPLLSYSQEVISDVSVNFQKKEKINSLSQNKSDKANHVLLPFKDDFSKESIFPDVNLWADNFAFINNSFPINPLTVGVATLDALNDSGMIYTQANAISFIADYLTSQPIRLDSVLQGSNMVPLKVSDSIYFSFFYQPQGIGNKPEGHDSIVLEFFSPSDSSWQWIWSDKGQSLQDFKTQYGTDFKQILIPLTDSLLFFHKDFRFRFFNYASIANNYEPSWAGNVDQWHIDYVYLNSGRSINDTVYEDVAFLTKPKSLLTTYQSVPWSHYSTSFQLNTQQELPYTNLSSITKNVNRQFSIIDLFDNSIAFTYSGGNLNLLPFETENFNVPITYTFASTSTDSAVFELRSIINTTPDINRNNDTVRFYQKFMNYYAYDDGTPENGYGLSTNTAQLAYKFTTNSPDTLKAIQMFFNQTYQDANQKNFYLRIWTGNNEPQNVIYEKSGITPIFEDELNKFHTYLIDTPLVLSGTFYIGWKQTTSDNLNIGFDRNTNSKDKIFYNVSGTWMNSMYDGSLMIRPMFGKMYNTSFNDIEKSFDYINLYPNPSNGTLFFKPDNPNTKTDKYLISIFDFTGRKIFEDRLQEKLELPSSLSNGIFLYYIQAASNNLSIQKGKFILIR